MIFDKTTNWENYFSSAIADKLRPAFELLGKLDANSTEQRYDIDGDNMFCMVASYETKAANEAQLEYHREYIDIQVLLAGEETIGWALPELTPETVAYNSDNDIAFHAYNATESSTVKLVPGLFAIFLTEEGHAPGLITNQVTTVKKAVVKIHRSLLA
ncbi:MAG: YhcH/YjgK/YiaL family protein [Victivallaceae bacterium]|nr:YhcH/YjgK/YiaL family protein [Victivallaceae bacterium]